MILLFFIRSVYSCSETWWMRYILKLVTSGHDRHQAILSEPMLEYCQLDPQWNFNRNSYISIQENAVENASCKMAPISSRPQCIHDGVIKWKLFPRYWPFVQGIHLSPVNSPHKDQWRGALMFSSIFRVLKVAAGGITLVHLSVSYAPRHGHTMKYLRVCRKENIRFWVVFKLSIVILLIVEIHRARGRHQMKTFSALLALCAWNSPITGEFPS